MKRRAIIPFLLGLVVLTAGRAAAQCVGDTTVSIPSFLNEEKNVYYNEDENLIYFAKI